MPSSHPDADLHPEATGPAAAIVNAHAKEEPLKLYSGWFCPFVQRAWTVLEEKKIPYQYIEDTVESASGKKNGSLTTNCHPVNPYHKPESLLKLNPRGLVPTLQYDNKPLFESTVILEFLEDAYPDHTPHLLPKDVYQRARTRIWTDYVTSRILPAFHRLLQFQPMTDESGLAEARTELAKHLAEFTKEMDPTGPFFLGKEPALVDFVLAPWAVRMWVFDHFKGGSGVPEEGKGGQEEEVWKRWKAWVKAIEERPSIRDTTSDREHYMPIYQRYADDKAQSELAKATRKGRGVP